MDENRPNSRPVPMPALILLGAVAGALALSSAVTWYGLRLMMPREEAELGFVGGTVASVIAGFASVAPLLIGARFGLLGVVGGYFAGSFVRAILSVGICLAAIRWWACPPVPTLLVMAVHYLAVLMAESIVVGRVLWKTPYRQVGA